LGLRPSGMTDSLRYGWRKWCAKMQVDGQVEENKDLQRRPTTRVEFKLWVTRFAQNISNLIFGFTCLDWFLYCSPDQTESAKKIVKFFWVAAEICPINEILPSPPRYVLVHLKGHLRLTLYIMLYTPVWNNLTCILLLYWVRATWRMFILLPICFGTKVMVCQRRELGTSASSWWWHDKSINTPLLP
jgi:hypothetical protein